MIQYICSVFKKIVAFSRKLRRDAVGFRHGKYNMMLHEESGANPEHYQGAVMWSDPNEPLLYSVRGRRVSNDAESEYELQQDLLE